MGEIDSGRVWLNESSDMEVVILSGTSTLILNDTICTCSFLTNFSRLCYSKEQLKDHVHWDKYEIKEKIVP
jgi:hypothetical protein